MAETAVSFDRSTGEPYDTKEEKSHFVCSRENRPPLSRADAACAANTRQRRCQRSALPVAHPFQSSLSLQSQVPRLVPPWSDSCCVLAAHPIISTFDSIHRP